MAASPPHAALPNPQTPLAFLPPTLANQFQVSEYLHVATCGMFAWDILTNLRNDYTLLTKYRLSLPTVVYFVSRAATIAYIVTGTIFTIGAVDNCQALQVAIGSCFAVAVPATSLLFFFRVKAVFNNNNYIVAFFSFLWLATLAGSLTVPFAISGTHIGPTKHCINTGVKPFSSAGVIVATVNDTLVFIFISWRLAQSSYQESVQKRAKSFFLGDGLPVLSRSLIQSGQEYYLITAAGNILTMGMILSPPSVPAVFHAMFTVPNIAIGNSMACRVYRDTKFGHINSNWISRTSQRSTPKAAPQFSHQLSHQGSRAPYDAPTKMEYGGNKVTPEYGIHISTTVERTGDIMSGVKEDPMGKVLSIA